MLGQVIRHRWWLYSLCLAGILQVVAAAAGYVVMSCPVWDLLHRPCPGCGLTRGVVELLRGHWRRGVEYHALAPAFAAGMVVLLLGAVLPDRARLAYADEVERFERATMLPMTVTLALLVYWMVRLTYLADMTQVILAK